MALNIQPVRDVELRQRKHLLEILITLDMGILSVNRPSQVMASVGHSRTLDPQR